MTKRRIHTMHLDGPLDGELFMKREGVDPDTNPDDIPEWIENDLQPEDLEDFDEEEMEDEGEEPEED